MNNVTLSQELANQSRAAYASWINDHDELIETLRGRLGLENSSEEFRIYADHVLADKPVDDHAGWFADIAGTARIVGDLIAFRKNKAEGRDAHDMGDTPTHTIDTDGFDIYDYAEKCPYADYMDMHTGLIYHIADYMRAKSFGLPTPGIAVSDNGRIIGYAKKMS